MRVCGGAGRALGVMLGVAACCAQSHADEPRAIAAAVAKAPLDTTAADSALAGGIPRLEPHLSSGLVPFADIQLQLELGAFNVDAINRLLGRAQAEFSDPNARLAFLMDQFKRTPFEYESQMKIPPADTLRVRLQSFGCTGFAIYMLALTSAGTFEEFVHALRKIRYLQSETRGLDSDPINGNILDFTEDVFLESALKQGYVRDVTAEVAGAAPRAVFRSRNVPRRRNAEEDPARHLILPKVNAGKVLTMQLISREAFTRMDRSRIKTGDILLFSRIVPDAAPSEELMFGHAAVALNRGGEIYMVHATRDYLWRPEAKAGDKPQAAGVYYLNDPRREQLGVTVATQWVRDPRGRHIRIDGKSYYGYSPEQPRPVFDYLVGAHIQGLAVLRPKNLTPEAKAADRRFLAAGRRIAAAAVPAAVQVPNPPAVQAPNQAPNRAATQAPVEAAYAIASGPAIIDSQMTLEQAVRVNLPKDCPPQILQRQTLVEVSYYARDGQLHKGQLVVDSSLSEDVRRVFAVILQTRFPVESVIPIAHTAFLRDGRWDDQKSMAANNTSGFNYRTQTGSRKLSAHSCGFAIDLNPGLNPYVKGVGERRIILPAGAVYDRRVPGTLTADHPVTKKFKELGWKWGGDFRNVKDFQHFEKSACSL